MRQRPINTSTTAAATWALSSYPKERVENIFSILQADNLTAHINA